MSRVYSALIWLLLGTVMFLMLANVLVWLCWNWWYLP